MNSLERPLPDIKSIYWSDFTIRRSLNLCGFGFFVAAGFWWATRQPTSPVVAPEEVMFNAAMAKYAIIGGLVGALIAGAVLIRRYRLVTKILRYGQIIPGVVEELDRWDTNRHSSSDTRPMSTAPTYAYYATIRYELNGREKKARYKLLHSPSTYRLTKGGETELLVLESIRHKPLIRSVYFFRRA